MAVRLTSHPEPVSAHARSDADNLPHTHIRVMRVRHVALRQTLAAYSKTLVPLVGLNEQGFFPSDLADDPALYYFVPWLAYRLHLQVESAYDMFILAVVLSCLSLGIAGLFLLYRAWFTRGVGLIGLIGIAAISLSRGDLYALQGAVVVAAVPWFLYLIGEAQPAFWTAMFFFLAGLGVGVAHEFRGYAGVDVLLIIGVVTLVGPSEGWRHKLAFCALLSLGVGIPVGYFRMLSRQRDAFLARVQPDAPRTYGQHHPFWHTAYIGLGFVQNEYVPAYLDEVGVQKVFSISPATRVDSPEYEQILKKEFFRVVKEHPGFFLENLFAKLGVIGAALLFFANFGLLAAFWYPKGWATELAFWLALSFDSMFGIFAIPRPGYLLGFMAVATVYCVVSIGYAVERYLSGEIRGWLAQRLKGAGLCAANEIAERS
jgi:hypothetical protein